MFQPRITVLVAALFALAGMPQPGAQVLVREEFENLDRWSPLVFPKIPAHSVYAAGREGDISFLDIRTDGGASGLILGESFDVREYPVLEWRWKIAGVVAGGDARRKDSDDYPVRVYVLFRYDRDLATAGMRLKYRTVRLLYGEYPPHAALNYIWANRSQEQRILPNAYTDRSMMVIMDAGPEHAGTWRTHVVDLAADYRAALGGEPPREATLAVMGDTDNTGGSARAAIDYIELRRR